MKPHIKEAYRYLENANAILKEKTTNDGKHYNDKKYVRMAGHTAYHAVLEALSPLMKVATKELGKKHEDVQVARHAVGKVNKKMLQSFNSSYDYLHIYMGYDGQTALQTKKVGFSFAKEIIEWADANTTALGGIKKEVKKVSKK